MTWHRQFLTSSSRRSRGKVTAFCLLNTSPVLFTCVRSLSVAVWRFATLTSLLKFCELKISLKLRKSDVLACVFPMVVVKRSFHPTDENQPLIKVIRLLPCKEFELTCTRRINSPATQCVLSRRTPLPPLSTQSGKKTPFAL